MTFIWMCVCRTITLHLLGLHEYVRNNWSIFFFFFLLLNLFCQTQIVGPVRVRTREYKLIANALLFYIFGILYNDCRTITRYFYATLNGQTRSPNKRNNCALCEFAYIRDEEYVLTLDKVYWRMRWNCCKIGVKFNAISWLRSIRIIVHIRCVLCANC